MKYNEIIKKVNKATTLKTVKKYADMLGVKLGNTKDVSKARNRVINKATSEMKSITQEVEKYKQKTFNKAKESIFGNDFLRKFPVNGDGSL